MRLVDTLVIHCTASPDGRSLFERERGSGRVTATPVEVVDRWHRARGFARTAAARKRMNPELSSIGYHFLVYLSGTVVTGRHHDEVGAHARGRNARSIGICLVGTSRYSAEQWRSLSECVAAQRRRWPAARVVGHRDLSPDLDGDGEVEPHEWTKTCPGFDVRAWVAADFAAPEAHLYQGPIT